MSPATAFEEHLLPCGYVVVLASWLVRFDSELFLLLADLCIVGQNFFLQTSLLWLENFMDCLQGSLNFLVYAIFQCLSCQPQHPSLSRTLQLHGAAELSKDIPHGFRPLSHYSLCQNTLSFLFHLDNYGFKSNQEACHSDMSRKSNWKFLHA